MSSSIWPENSETGAAAASTAAAASSSSSELSNSRRSNVSRLLARREVSPRTNRSPKRFWVKGNIDASGIRSDSAKDARRELLSWLEARSLLHLSAKYCSLLPPPRSTIAAAFSPDGKTLASTHGDHTVKIIDCETGKKLKELSGHRRTPWVVRFHPLYPEVFASGSLDHEVRLWDAKTADCIASHDFYRPIASIAFHAQGEILAVASGHRLYIWNYNVKEEGSLPTMILKTRRTLRAVHFHPLAAPFLLTAEVNDLDSGDPSMTIATCPGYLQYPAPIIYLADDSGNEPSVVTMPFVIFPSSDRGDGNLHPQQTDIATNYNASQQRVNFSSSVPLLTYSTPSGQYELVLSPVREEPQSNSLTREMENANSQHAVNTMETDLQGQERNIFPFVDPALWEVPFLQGWLIGQNQASQRAINFQNGGATEALSSYTATRNPPSVIPGMIPSNIGNSRSAGSSGSTLRNQPSHSSAIPADGYGDGAVPNSIPIEPRTQLFTSRVQAEIATSLAAAAAAELPCTVKLRIWSYNVKNSCESLETDRCRLTIPHVVLCSEMGAHFSPCGRFLAVCVACILPNMDSEPGFHSQVQVDVTAASSSPTRHPISVHQVMYELRIYSLEEATFGSVLASRAIKAAHCLTSIQFSPTSEHLLLAYGRRHSSLLNSVVIVGDTTVPIYTILEIYRVSDMEIVRVLPSAEDEVNVACFHPLAGGGLVYGTKEGKLRILQCHTSQSFVNEESCVTGENTSEVQTYAFEG